MSAVTRYGGVSMLLLGTTGPASTIVTRRYGRAAGRSFRLSMTLTLIAQQALVGLALKRSGAQNHGRQHRLNLVDLMTLSRAWAASLLTGFVASGIRDRRGVAGWMGWLAVLYGSILCDWLDGPLARHRGTSTTGALLDREADSWLTLCAGAGAVAWGDLSPVVASAPLLRYMAMFEALRTRSYADLHADEPRWVRPLGIVQMLVFIAALAPFRGRATWRLVRLIAPLQTPLQLLGLILWRRRMRRT